MSKLKFVQINLHKAKQAQIEIAKRVRKMNMQGTSFICLVQEPMTDKNRTIFQPNSCQVFCKGKNPRASIYLSTSIKAWYMESLSTPDMTVVQMKLNNRSTLIVSVYMDINNTAVIPDELDKVMDYVNQKGLAIIIGADTNAHSTNYGPTGNTRGDKVDLFTAQHRLSIENRGDIATFHGRGCNTFIDATFTSKLSVSIKDWKVCTDYNGSDHNTILFNTDIEYEQVLPQWQCCLLYTSPSPRDKRQSRMPSSA